MKRAGLIIAMIVFTCAWAMAESSVWKVTKGDSVTYLGGTCHILRKSDYPLPKEFDEAYKASDVLVLETDIGRLRNPNELKKLMTNAVYTDGTTIGQHLSAEAYGALREYCEDAGVPLFFFQQFKPPMLIVVLMGLELARMGVTEQGVDMYYERRAKADKKTVQSLETVEEQVSFLLAMADGCEDDFVKYSVSDLESTGRQYGIIVDAWKKGDSEQLAQLMVADLEKLPTIEKKLLTNRNENWMPLIEAFTQTPRTEFVLVGVAHMVGTNGLLESLKKKGYAVEKL